jgi:hypothetical protein
MGVHDARPPARSGPPAAVSASEARENTFKSNYIEFQYVFVNFITEHLIDCSKVFAGDLQKVLILAIIGQATLNMAQRNGDAQGQVPQESAGPITASSLADITGIPRETVRRKLHEIAADGWIERTDDGSWRLRMEGGEARAGRDLAALDARGIRRAARLYTALGSIGSGESGAR